MPTGERALFMYASPRNYVASILAGENSVKELEVLAPSRAQRIAQRAPARSAQRATHADLAAIGWACEMTALEAAADAMIDRRIEWLDFDRMLDAVEVDLARIARLLRVRGLAGTTHRNRRGAADAPLLQGA